MARKKIIFETELDNKQTIGALSDMEDQVESTTGAVTDFGTSTQKSVGGIGGSLDSLPGPLSNAVGGVKALGKQFLALLANPIVLLIAAIVAVLALLFKSFTKSEEGSNRLKKGMAVLNGIFAKFLQIIEPIAEFVADALTEAFDAFAESVALATEGVIQILEALSLADAAESVREFRDEGNEMVKTSLALADAEAELVRSRREEGLVTLQALAAAEKQRQVRDDESKSIEERKAANTELARILQQQSEDELSLAQKALDVAVLRQRVDGETTEVLDELAAAKLQVAEIDERIIGQQSEQLVNINALNREEKALAKERSDRAKQRRKEIEEAEIKRRELIQESELIIRDIAIQNLIEGAEKEGEIVRAQFDDKIRVAIEKFGEESAVVLALQAEQREKVQTAEDEFNAAQSEKDAAELKKRQEAEVVALEQSNDIKIRTMIANKEAADEIAEAEFQLEIEELTLKRENELISLEEFNLLKLEAEVRLQDSITAKQEEEAEKRKAIADEGFQNAISAGNQIASINSDLAQAAVNNAEGNEEKQQAIRKKSFERNKKIQIGLAVISGIQGVINALTANSVIPEPFGTVLKVANAVAVGIATAANIAKIKSTKFQGGGSVGGASTGGGGAPAPQPQQLFAAQELPGTETDTVGQGAGSRQNTIRAVISESEVTNAQNTINNFETFSEIG